MAFTGSRAIIPTVVDYLISQRDERVERADQVAAVRETYSYNLEMGFPVAAGTTDEDGPALRWQIKSLEAQERLRMNLRLLKRRGKWNFVNDLQPLAPLKLASMIRADDMAGIVDYFMPVPGGIVGDVREKSLQDFRDVFALSQPPSIVERFRSDEYFAENFVAGPDPTRLRRMVRIPEKFPLLSAHLTALPEFATDDLDTAITAGRVYWVDYEAMLELDDGAHPQARKYMYSPMVAFCVPRKGGALRPFAIQTGQDPAGREVYTPADGYSWSLARTACSPRTTRTTRC